MYISLLAYVQINIEEFFDFTIPNDLCELIKLLHESFLLHLLEKYKLTD
jgi:hypothetical protein